VSQTTSWSTACLLGYAPLIRKIYVPKAIFILATVLSGLVNLLISLIPLAMIMVVVRHPIHASVLFLPLSILLATVFALGLSLLLAGICIEFNDVVQIYQALLARVDVPDAHRLPARRSCPSGTAGDRREPTLPAGRDLPAPIYAGVLPDGATVLRRPCGRSPS